MLEIMIVNSGPFSNIDMSIIISIIALLVSLLTLYFQFFHKKKKLLLNIFDLDYSERQPRNIAISRLSLSNVGNTPVLLSDIRFQTKALDITATYITTIAPNNLPVLIKPDDTFLYTINSGSELYLNAIKDLTKNGGNAHEFNLYLEFSLVVNGYLGKYQILLNKTLYYNPNKVHSQSSTMTKNIILNKYRSDFFYISYSTRARYKIRSIMIKGLKRLKNVF